MISQNQHTRPAFWIITHLLVLAMLAAPAALAQPAQPPQPGPDPATARAEQVRAEATALLKQIEARQELERCWDYMARLVSLAREMPDAVRDAFRPYNNSDNPRIQIAIGRVSATGLEDKLTAGDKGMQVLGAAMADKASIAKVGAEAICAAADLVNMFADSDAQINGFFEFYESDEFGDLPESAKLAMARAARVLDNDDSALALIEKLATSASSPEVRNDAVLALAEESRFDKIRTPMRSLSMRPGTVGSLARTLLDNESIRREIKAETSGSGSDVQHFPGLPDYSGRGFIAALTLTVHRFASVRERETGSKERGDYRLWTVDDQIAPKQLLDNACRGMLRHVDNYSVFMTGKDMKDMTEEMEGKYGGIGAYVGLENGVVTISQPIYEYIVQQEDGSFKVVKGPAYAAGIRSGDQILGGNGKDFTGWPLDDVIKELKGTPGTPVTVKIMRRGWTEPKMVSVLRAEIEINTAQYEMLPGGIGYIKLIRFGYNSHDDMEKALQALEKAGMKALVLDLRENPGGALNAVTEIADKFLSGRKLITSLKGRWGKWAKPEETFTQNQVKPRTLPMAVMINNNSASGSELLSGCLQDQQRATIIGQTSYGKGVGQAFFFVLSSLGQGDGEKDPEYNGFSRWLRLTTFAYYLPSGRSINNVGVKPDIPMDDKIHFQGVHYSCEYIAWSGWQLAEVDRILATTDEAGLDPVRAYVAKNFPGNEAKFLALCDYDNLDASAYPGFDEWYASLKTTLSKDDARRLLRLGRTPFRTGGLRLACADQRGRDYYQNFQEDPVLQRAITEVAGKLGLDLKKVEQYSHFAK
ncbi:MAG: S41 family peptidase [Planctomycetota bacterium]